MNTFAISGAIALFLLLGLLLLSLNIFSLWRWWVKALMIVVTLGSVVVLYFTMTGLIGWASTAQMPARFSLLSTRIVEPDKLKGLPGHIYLWVEEVDDEQVVISPPRAFEVPYEVETASNVATAQQQIEGGGKDELLVAAAKPFARHTNCRLAAGDHAERPFGGTSDGVCPAQQVLRGGTRFAGDRIGEHLDEISEEGR